MKIKLKYRVGSFLTENSDERKLSWENICRHFLAGSQQFQFSIQFNFEWTFATTCLVISELSTQSFLFFFFFKSGNVLEMYLSYLLLFSSQDKLLYWTAQSSFLPCCYNYFCGYWTMGSLSIFFHYLHI